jgi:hypothetical protein
MQTFVDKAMNIELKHGLMKQNLKSNRETI